VGGGEETMKSKFALTKRKRLILATVVICAVLITSLAILWQGGGKVSQAALVEPHPGLIGWWRFDEGTGTVAGDSSGNGNNGAFNGPVTWVLGKYGNASSFGGSTYVEIDNVNLPFAQNYSVSVWVNPSAYADMFLFGRINDVNWYVLFGSGGAINDWASGGGLDWNPNVPYVTGQWQHFVFVYNGTYKLVYRNGVLAASTAQASAAGSGLYVGRYGGYTSYEFQGVVDEVQIYNRALSASEILAGFQASPDFSSNLLAKVPMGTTDFIATLSWQGTGSINVTIQSPSTTYTESMMHVYQKTTYSVSGGTSAMLNIKRLEVGPIGALGSDQNWYIVLVTSNVQDYKITVEVQT
jgi:hypothetical protein